MAVCVFYLVLRALDTVEDDMTIAMETKVRMLREFHTYLHLPEWSYSESKEKDRAVLEEFPTVSGMNVYACVCLLIGLLAPPPQISAEFRSLPPMYQEVIEDITHSMGCGMTVFLERKIDTMAEWDEVSKQTVCLGDCQANLTQAVCLLSPRGQYCHYAAGLVGVGLSRLFAASGKEATEVGRDTQLANSMGLFLQKTNIIRDYLEDSLEGREFWPQEVCVCMWVAGPGG